jgi:hypothetical protein
MTKNQLQIPQEGAKIPLYTKSGTLVAESYERVVIGGRGPYVEFSEKQIELSSFIIPKNQLYRLSDLRIYYIEFRSNDESNVKLYYQLKTVAYADYKIGYFYVDPYELYSANGTCVIKDINHVDEICKTFFDLC